MKKKAAYDPSKIEKKWQKKWASSKLYKSTEKGGKKGKFYVLDMFPYPSGEGLHVGHPKGYIATDIISRMNRMQGKNVLHPMGFDAFGLPAENYAIKTKTNPEIAVKKNVARYKKQLELLGFDYDWSREVNTTDQAFYKWTQWIFLQLLKKGLAYESNEPVNWCPTDKTVLANEDVEDGRCERCGTPVEKRPMRQWVLRITDYADRLLNDLDAKNPSGKAVLEWPEAIKESQRNWIGRSEGAEIDFRLVLKSRKIRFVLIHGYKGSPEDDFFPWLKAELEKMGHEVQVPNLPSTEDPRESEQVEYILKNCKFDENTVVVGHSLGGVVALKALMKLNRPISGLVLAATASAPEFSKDSKPRPYHKNFKFSFDYELIKKLTSGRIAVLSDKREPNRLPWLKHLSQNLSAALIETESVEKHFTASKEPALLECVIPKVKVFTTRPDTLFGVTYVVLAPEHPWVKKLLSNTENKAEVEAYISKTERETEIERTDATKEKTGIELKGIKAVNPVNGEEVPVWIADYVLADYGTGAVMAVPAHDERDYAFAKKFGLAIKQVVEPKFMGTTGAAAIKPDMPFVKRDAICAIVRNPKDDTYMCISWKGIHMHGLVTGGIESGEDVVETARREILEETGYKNLKHIRTSPVTAHTFFHHLVKKQNRHAHFRFVFFELENDERAAVDEKESALHEVLWIKKDGLKDFFSVFEGEFALKLIDEPDYVHVGSGMLANSGKFDGKDSDSIMKEITGFAGGKWVTKYKLRDWVFSRQRYWGEPIPVIHCGKCGVVAVPEKELPVKLPKVKQYEPTGTGESPLAAISKWVNVKCPQCKGKARRETNTMPQWAGSSWYYLRYMDPKNKTKLVDPKKEKYWAPVDFYVGGAEHATRHLIYARFWHKFLLDIGVVSTLEPFTKLQSVGLIMGEDGRKMSKRFGNVVNPDDIVGTYGADTMRIYEMFMGPFDQQIAWSTTSMVGSRRFIERVWKLADRVIPSTSATPRIIHKAIKKVTEDISAMRFNTAISTLMITLNELEKNEIVTKDGFSAYLKLLAPFAPHVTEELWASLGNKKSIHIAEWPKYDPAQIADEEVTIIVQVNGKTRGSFTAASSATKDEIGKAAKGLPQIGKWLEGKEIKKVVVVPGRLVNFVI